MEIKHQDNSNHEQCTPSKYGCVYFFLIPFLIYVSVYIVLSMQGEYILNNRGGLDWRENWRPKFLVYPAYPGDPKSPYVLNIRTKIYFSTAGKFYLPLIFIDWLFWHPTVWDAG